MCEATLLLPPLSPPLSRFVVVLCATTQLPLSPLSPPLSRFVVVVFCATTLLPLSPLSPPLSRFVVVVVFCATTLSVLLSPPLSLFSADACLFGLPCKPGGVSLPPGVLPGGEPPP